MNNSWLGGVQQTYQQNSQPQGNYWIGSDGNVWVAGSRGVNNAGRADANTHNYWASRGYSKIDDPNAPRAPQTSGVPFANPSSPPPRNSGGGGYGGGGGGGYAPPKVYAPFLDLNKVSADARAVAEQNVTPLYVKKVNDMVARMNVMRQRANENNARELADFEERLQDTLSRNTMTRERVATDVETNVQNLNQEEDNFQVDSGAAFEDQRLQAAANAASTGMGMRGVVTQNMRRAEQDRNTIEGRAVQQSRQQKAAQTLYKARTFEDLKMSDEKTQRDTAKGKERATIDLNRLMQDYDYEEQQSKNKYEQERMNDILSQTQQQSRIMVNNFINSIADPAVREAALGAYGRAF